jgi:hypothetical protein
MSVGHTSIPEGQFMVMAKHVIGHLFPLTSDEGRGHTVGVFNMDAELKSAGFQRSIAQFTFLLYELGIVKKLKRDSKTRSYRYFVLNPKLFDSRVTDEVVEVALKAVQKRTQRTDEICKLRKSNETTSTKKSSGLNDEHVAAMAEMVAEVERLTAELANRNQEIAELKQQSTVTAEDTAAALIARFKKAKAG